MIMDRKSALTWLGLYLKGTVEDKRYAGDPPLRLPVNEWWPIFRNKLIFRKISEETK